MKQGRNRENGKMAEGGEVRSLNQNNEFQEALPMRIEVQKTPPAALLLRHRF